MLQTLVDKTKQDAPTVLLVLAGVANFVMVIALSAAWYSISVSGFSSGSSNLFKAGAGFAGAMVVLSFLALLFVTFGLVQLKFRVAPAVEMTPKVIKGMAGALALAAFLLLIGLIAAFVTDIGGGFPGVTVTKFGAGTFFGIVGLLLEVFLAVLVNSLASGSPAAATPSVEVTSPKTQV